MQITIDLPDKLTDKVKDTWGDLSQKVLGQLVLEAFLEGLINFYELKEILNFSSDDELKEFFKQKNMLHSAGIINLSGTCPELELIEDDLEIDDNLNRVFDE